MSRPIKIYRSVEAPGDVAQGDLKYDTTTNSFSQYNGASWHHLKVDGLRVAAGYASTNSTDSVFEIPGVAGAPTGVITPTTGTVSIVYDTTNRSLKVRSGGSWFTTASLSIV